MTTTLVWPDRPTCHDSVYPGSVWLPPRVPDVSKLEMGGPEIWRGCSYCGSIHPEDLFNFLKDGKASLSGSDWKYSWPHKFYLKIANPEPQKEWVVSSRYRTGQPDEHTLGTYPTLYGKFYSSHMRDLDRPAMEALAALVFKETNILFGMNAENKLAYKAPYFGYQKP